jgi:adenine deaminase
MTTVLQGNIVDIRNRRIYPGQILLEDDRIKSIEEVSAVFDHYIMPGFIDAHVHIESSMLVPSEFAKLAVLHGTVGTVSDPHEIANVMGIEGVHYMINNGKQVPFKFNFGAPSCVPATTFETAGATINEDDILELLMSPDIKYLAEMMNYPGVIHNDEVVLKKINHAHQIGLPVDGHAPGLIGEQLKKYISAGISTDHEAFTYEEALEKLDLGMKILIREGSAAKNFDALIDLLPDHFQNIMFCSDDKHPDDLVVGHINDLVLRALEEGHKLFDVLQVACINPIDHYNLDIGDLSEGSYADFIVVEDLNDLKVLSTYINGNLVAKEGQCFIETVPVQIVNNFNTDIKTEEQFVVPAENEKIRVIEAMDGELITNDLISNANVINNKVESDIQNDVLKITVVNRYNNCPPAVAFIKGFGLTYGAIASCVGHDSHNIIAVGTNDNDITKAVNLIIENQGGIAIATKKESAVLPLPIAGIMSDQDGLSVAHEYSKLDLKAKELGSKLSSPFMTLSFMALLVIPSLKLSDLGLFDGNKFEFVN